jgi:NADH-quinone oxidoreductase subunit A
MTAPGLYLLAFLTVIATFVGALILGARALRVPVKRRSPLASRPYECGEEPDGPVWIRFHPRYYLVALVFLIFDVEVAFLFPWAVSGSVGTWLSVAAIGLFVAVLLLGWWYALRKEALRWQ